MNPSKDELYKIFTAKGRRRKASGQLADKEAPATAKTTKKAKADDK